MKKSVIIVLALTLISSIFMVDSSSARKQGSNTQENNKLAEEISLECTPADSVRERRIRRLKKRLRHLRIRKARLVRKRRVATYSPERRRLTRRIRRVQRKIDRVKHRIARLEQKQDLATNDDELFRDDKSELDDDK